MKRTTYILTLLILWVLPFGCSSDDPIDTVVDPVQKEEPKDPENPDEPGTPTTGGFQMADVVVSLPAESDVNLMSTTFQSLGKTITLTNGVATEVPINTGSYELGYLLDDSNNVLLAGFLSDNRKELNLETTAEVMLYYALDYYLLPESGKKAFLDNVRKLPSFSSLVSGITDLFVQDPMMYSAGTYTSALETTVSQITAKKTDTNLSSARIFFKDDATKSGVTLSSVDSTHIRLQNALPRRSEVVIYKKSVTDRNGNVMDIANYLDNPVGNFELETGKLNQIAELEVGSPLAQISTQQASIDNASDSGPILLPVNPATEFVAEYEVVLIGSGLDRADARNMTAEELRIYTDLTKKTYILDYFLPTLLDVGGNKSLLPPFGSTKETALVNSVLPVLEQYPDVMQRVIQNEFKEATKLFLPALYDDIRLSNDLRNLLQEVYQTLSGNGEFPNTFIQSQELIETGLDRTKVILRTIDQNIKATNTRANFGNLRTEAFNFESWSVKSIDAVVEMQQDNVELCLGEATELRVTVITDFDPEVEEFEFHWSTSNKFGGRVQDIGDDANNFGVSIVSKNNFVSYISTALESDLGNGNNPETVTVVLYFRNKMTGVLTEAGRDKMTVNNIKTCESFTVPFERQPNFREIPDSTCPNDIGFQAFSPVPYRAAFEAVDGAIGYKGIITRSNGLVNDEITLNVEDLGDGLLSFTTGVGSIRIFNSCNEGQAEAKAQEFVNSVTIEPATIEITPIFN